MDPSLQQPTPNLTPPPPTVAPAPVSPPEVAGIPNPDQGALSQEQMMANLQQLMAKIESSYQGFGSQKFASDNKLKELKSQILRQLFDLLQSKGVDPNNPDQVKAFLDKIQANNPELYQQVEEALQIILGDSQDPAAASPAGMGVTDPGTPPPDTMNMNPNEAVPQNV